MRLRMSHYGRSCRLLKLLPAFRAIAGAATPGFASRRRCCYCRAFALCYCFYEDSLRGYFHFFERASYDVDATLRRLMLS